MNTQLMVDRACGLIEPEIERILNLPSLDNATLEQLHMLVVTKEKLLRIEEIENKLNGGYDEASFRRGGMYNRGNSNDYRMPSRPVMSYDDGYSRDDSMAHLEEAMRLARNEQERNDIRQLMTRYHQS